MVTNLFAGSKENYSVTCDYYDILLSDVTTRKAELSAFITLLPKGGDIHHHFNGAIYAETLLAEVEKKGYCINKDTYRVLFHEPKSGCLSVDEVYSNRDYHDRLLNKWSNWAYVNNFPLTFSPVTKFFHSFEYLLDADNFIPQSLDFLKKWAKDENVQYIETMLSQAPTTENPAIDEINILFSNMPDAALNAAFERAFCVMEKDSALQEEILNYIKNVSINSIGIDDEDFTMCFQAWALRILKPSLVFSGLYSSFKASQGSSKIVGINIVGEENNPVALKYYLLHMKMIRFLKHKFPTVKVALHAGELALGMVSPEHLKYHINDALQIAGADRIGHGADVMHEYDSYGLLSSLKSKNVLIEVNFTSNKFLLGIEPSQHPIMLYLQFGVPIAISSDDPAVLRINLSNEYLIFVSNYKPSYDQLKKIVYSSIEYSFLSSVDKERHITLLDKKFVDFEQYIAIHHSKQQKSLFYK